MLIFWGVSSWSSLLVVVTFRCLTFTLQGFPNIWSYLCYKKLQFGYVLTSNAEVSKTKYLDQINQVISPLSVLLQVYESMSQTFILCELGMNHSRVVFPKGGCTKMLGNSNSWTVWQSKQFTILKQMMWWGCCSIISKKKVCRDLFWESSLLVDLTSDAHRRWEEILSHRTWDIVVTQTNWRCEHHGFSPWLFHGFFWRFLGFSRVFSFPEWYSLSMFQQRQHPQS